MSSPETPRDETTASTAPVTAAPIPAAAPVAPTTRAGLDDAVEIFVREYLSDRRQDRRWRTFFRFSWLALFLLLVWVTLSSQATHTSSPTGPHTAMVVLHGEISADSDANAERIVAGLKSAFEDEAAKAVVLRINSPGGSPVQAGIINDEIVRLKAKHKKKIYAVVEESCASGAYYVAAAADAIYVDKASVVGSIGVLMDSFGFDKAMSRYGVERRLLTAGENKGIMDPFSPMNDKQRALVQAMLDQIHRQFIEVVREGRGKKLRETPEMFSGLFWNGEEAVKLGLADALGNIDFVAREIVKAEEVVDYTPKENVAERLAKRFGASMGAGAVQAMRSLGQLH